MKAYLFSFIVLLFYSCANMQNKGNLVSVDLTKNTASIPYSSFVNSLSYLTLKMDDSSFLSNVDRLYADDGLIFLKGGKKDGLLVFSLKDGTIISHLNYFGQGPGEFSSIRAFTLDRKKKQIHIFSYPFLHKYTYEGHFLETMEINTNFVDFYHLNTGEYICTAPEEVRGDFPEGVWLVDSTFQFIKTLKDIPTNQQLAVRSIFGNQTENGIYYYDPVWEDISYITRDSVKLLFKVDFKQRVLEEERIKEIPGDLSQYSYINTFAYSEQYILSNYFSFDGASSYWALFDKGTKQTIVSQYLWNDLGEKQINSNNLFYINNKIWCRVLDFEENDPSITIEFIHLK